MRNEPVRRWQPISPGTTWFARRALAACLPVQAALLFVHLDRLPVWGDEEMSLYRAGLSLGDLVRELHTNVHPPLYFLLLRVWLSLPRPFDPIVTARALSGLCLLVATLAIDRCWLRRTAAGSRPWFLALWTVSPAAILYGRMARSYTLQLLLACIALYAAQQCLNGKWRTALPGLVAAGIALLYTHYLSGLAVVTAITMLGLWHLRREDRAKGLSVPVAVAVVGLAFLPWMPAFAAALARILDTPPHGIFPSGWLDAIAALGFAFVSFTFGESLELWMAGAACALAPAVLFLLARGARARPGWLWLVGPAAGVAFAGSRLWVSCAFVAARLLFLLPFHYLLLVVGGERLPRTRAIVCGALLCFSLASLHAYSGQRGFLNKGYVIPAAEIESLRAYPKTPPVGLRAIWGHLRAVLRRQSST